MKTSVGAPCAPRAPHRLRLALVCALAALLPGTALAKTKHSKKLPKVAVNRVAQGQVLNGGHQPLEGAVVYLEDPNSLAIKSYLSTAGGQFHFDHLAAQTDYEIWAEQNGVESTHRFISQFNSRTQFHFTLVVEPAGKHKFLGFL